MATAPSSELYDRQKRKQRFQKIDCIAVITLLAVFCYHFIFISYGAGYNDESFYYTIVQRLVNGDRLLVDEWFLTQLSAVLEIIPYKIAFWICGGTEGIILTLRYLFFFCRIPLACVLWGLLRKYKIWGLFGLLTYLLFIDFDDMTFSYYTMSMDGLILASAVFFLSEKPTPLKQVFSGFVFACVVLAEPFSVFLYLVYTVCVICAYFRNKKRPAAKKTDPHTEPKVWFYFSCGCMICAVLFFVFLLINSDIKSIARLLPELLRDSEYNLLHESGGRPRILRKALRIISIFGVPLTVFFFVFAIAVYLVMKTGIAGKNTYRFRLISFLIVCAASVAAFFMLMREHQALQEHQLSKTVVWFFFAPFQLQAILFFLLCEKKEPACMYLLITGLLFSFALDSISQVMIGLGGCLCQFSGWISLGILLREFAQHKPENGVSSKKAFARSVPVVCGGIAVILCMVLWQATFIRAQLLYPTAESDRGPKPLTSLDTAVNAGPQKGLRTTESVNATVSKLLSDIDRIQEERSGPLYILGNTCFLYLHAKNPCACYTTLFQYPWIEKQTAYWTLFPERIPQTVYIPFYDATKFARLDDLTIDAFLSEMSAVFDYDAVKGKAGYILEIKNVKI